MLNNIFQHAFFRNAFVVQKRIRLGVTICGMTMLLGQTYVKVSANTLLIPITESSQSQKEKSEAIKIEKMKEELSNEEITTQEEAGPPNQYSVIYYYEASRLERYEAYQKKYPKMLEEEVVWKVNADLDIPFYSQTKIIENTEQLPLLVNKYNRVPEDYVPKNLVKLSNGLQVTQETKEAFEAMQKDGKAKGYSISVNSAYRTISYQNGLFVKNIRANGVTWAEKSNARPGFSEHHTGRALDLAGSKGTYQNFINTKESKWIEENCHNYGFIVRYKNTIRDITGYIYEPWHVVYVGIEATTIMHDEKIDSLEEYVVKYVDHVPPEKEAPLIVE